VSGQGRFLSDQRAAGEHAARLLVPAPLRARTRAVRLADTRRRRPPRRDPTRPARAWAAGAVIALARVSGLIGTRRPVGAQQVAEDFGVTLGALTVTERELARALHLARYARRPPARSKA